jgi:competence protein ComEA
MRSRALVAIVLAALAGLSLAAGPGPASAPAASKRATPPKPVALIDINSASRAQLKTLPGIGEAEADKIVAGRPYLSKADLATHNMIPTGIYLSLKNRIIAKQPTKTKRKT